MVPGLHETPYHRAAWDRSAAPVVLLAPDKFRGSLTAMEAAASMAAGAREAGCSQLRQLPLSDGGEGFLDVLVRAQGGRVRTATVVDALGAPITAEYGLLGSGEAVVESAAAIGLDRAGACRHAMAATSRGVGELIAAALRAGAQRILVGVGGTASTDGGLGAVEALRWSLGGAEVVVACDVQTPFATAARVYGPQKGADPEQVGQLSERLVDVAATYQRYQGVDVLGLPGAGAGGGLAGGLAALGARLVSGFDLVARRVRLSAELARAAAVVTGEGALDATSMAGKVVGRVLARSGRAALGYRLVLAGTVDRRVGETLRRRGVTVCSLTEEAGPSGDPITDAAALISEICRRQLAGLGVAAP